MGSVEKLGLKCLCGEYFNSSKLKTLKLMGCNCESALVVDVCRHCPDLTTLDLSGNPNLSSDDVLELLQVCTKLERIELVDCRAVTSIIFTGTPPGGLKRMNVVRTGITREEAARMEEKASFSIRYKF